MRDIMKVITSHERTDMDALAAIYAASLVYPDHQAVLPQKLNRNLQEFLALYRDELPFIERRDLPRRPITRLVLVDTQAISQLRGMDSHATTHIIDHHPIDEPLPRNTTFEGDTVGATTTLLVEKIRERDIPVSRLGASLMLLGIYEDTGSLAYQTTTSRDLVAAAWLLDAGADLALVDEFLHRPLSPDQRTALAELTRASTMLTVQGRSICIAGVALEEPVDELATLVHELLALYEPDACFLLAEFAGDVQLIARSNTDAIDVARVLGEFGGGGHTKAAAALVQGERLDDVRSRLVRALEPHVVPPVRVRAIMSMNVHTVEAGTSIREAGQLMQRYGHEGFPVVEENRLAGILTRRDVDRALHHRLGDMPVRGFMHTGPVFVQPHDPVDEVQRVMIENDLGQVPVVEDGHLLGIVTRTDLIKLWYPNQHPAQAPMVRRAMEEALPQGLRDLLLRARDVANDLGYSLYIVGGFVRDLLLGSPTLDLDLVVEGDAIRMARRLAEELGDCRVRSHARFGTAKIIFEGERDPSVPPTLDFVTARTEFYERPTVLPQVERSSIKQDLYRRDFTINTMAICLDRERYGELLDYYGGERDIRQGLVRVLHNLSFVEDPTRILRAVRLEQRLGFTIEERTAELIDDAIELLDHVSGERLRNELYALLREERPERGLERLARMGVLARLHPDLRFNGEMAALFARLRRRFEEPEAPAGQGVGAGQDGPGAAATGHGAGATGRGVETTGQDVGATGQGAGATGQGVGATGQGVGAADDRRGVGAADDRRGVGAADDRRGVGAADDRLGVGAADDRLGVGAADDRLGVGATGRSPLRAREGDVEGLEDAEEAPTLSLCYLALLSSSLSREALHAFVERLRIPQSDAHLLLEVGRLRESLAELRSPVMLPSGIHRLLHPYSREARFVLSVLTDSERVRQRLDLYEREWSTVRPTIDGHTLRALGVPPGPVYGEILARVRDALLDGEIAPGEGELELARSLVRSLHGQTNH